jgi:EAL domain-containing protein (putative c-di-GMP-specific phosphodiesterase class I)
VSIGVATASDPGISPDSLIRDADAAMYRAKRRGGGEAAGADDEITFTAAMPVGSEQRAEFANQLRDAVSRSELRVYYQPQYGLTDSDRVAGFEALVRWQHPDRGLVPPGDFIPLAEELGISAEIGRFVLHQALLLLVRLRESQADLTVSVNLSRDQLADPELAAALAAVGASGLQPNALCVDIRESTVSEDPDAAIRASRVLHAAGIRVAIDDYGTGSAPLHSLRRLQADELKIHESFVMELNGTAKDNAVVGAVVELGHALGMTVVAEGVETDQQLLELRSLGCDGAQGYLLCRPVVAEQLEELIMHAA